MTAKKRAPIISNLHEVIMNKEKRSSYTFTYKFNGESYYTVGEQKITPDKFNSLFPIEFKFESKKGKNSDRTKSWMQGEKSY
jgi:hypothetical protein